MLQLEDFLTFREKVRRRSKTSKTGIEEHVRCYLLWTMLSAMWHNLWVSRSLNNTLRQRFSFVFESISKTIDRHMRTFPSGNLKNSCADVYPHLSARALKTKRYINNRKLFHANKFFHGSRLIQLFVHISRLSQKLRSRAREKIF